MRIISFNSQEYEVIKFSWQPCVIGFIPSVQRRKWVCGEAKQRSWCSSDACHFRLFVTPWTAAGQASLPFTVSQSLLRLISIVLMMPSNSLTLCCPLLLLPSIFSRIRVFSNELVLHIRWPKSWSFSISLPMNIQGWFPLGLASSISLLSTGLPSLLQHHS